MIQFIIYFKSNSYILTDWHIHCVTPIFKSGDRSNVSNYRPISLFGVFSKVFVLRCLKRLFLMLPLNFSLIVSLHTNSVLCQVNPPSSSYSSSLMTYLNDSKNNNIVVDVIYFDFRKAFNSVSHAKLLLKLQSYGISSTLLQWYRAYLTSCFQYVHINNSSSDLVPALFVYLKAVS